MIIIIIIMIIIIIIGQGPCERVKIETAYLYSTELFKL